VPDAAGNFKGVSLSGVSNPWLDSLESLSDYEREPMFDRVGGFFECCEGGGFDVSCLPCPNCPDFAP
jgi:hypothetical protein